MSIKTVHITNAYHRASGGISTFYHALLNGANRHGRLLYLIAPSDKTMIEAVGEFGRIYHVKAPHAPFFDRRYRLLLPHTYSPFFHGALKQILKQENPDLVEVCDKYSLNWLAGLLRQGWIPGVRRPVLVGMSCERMDDNFKAFLGDSRAGRWWSRFYMGNLYIPLFDYHIANSQYTADELNEVMVPRHERPVYIRPMGADLDDYGSVQPSESYRQKLLAQIGGGERTKILLYAGRLSPEKNLGLLIEMMEKLANGRILDYRLLVAGSGPLAEWFENEARLRVPGLVSALGHIGDRRALVELYTNCDAFVHPNPREPFGIAPLEAMAASLPLVAPRSGGVLSYADEKNAWLAGASGEEFAASIRSVFAVDSIRNEKLARARETARRYSWESVTAQFFDLYDELHADFPKTRFARKLIPFSICD